MLQLTGNNLPKRQKELNIKVNEAVANNTDFESLKVEADLTDIDKFFKIDLAAKYKNVEYIIGVLKSGDSLCISRALKKAVWLYADEYSDTMNANYFENQVFPYMSNKMKNKLLSTISTYLRDENRATDFYKYCLQTNSVEYAHKFLILTSESFKLRVIKEGSLHTADQHFFGNSFVLFNAYLENHEWNKNPILRDFSYFYTVSNDKYLDLLERYATIKSNKCLNLGLRTSKHIATKHKDRILANPHLYVNILNMPQLVRNSTLNELKLYAVSVLPSKSSEFWKMNFYKQFKLIIDSIPEGYVFVKKIFTDKYNEEFEMLRSFYDQKYYSLMTSKEKEDWALCHITAGKEILGSGRDYIWYKFVNFEKAFVEVKKLIITATNPSQRLDLLKVLAESAKSSRELEKMFDYYYVRHVNETKSSKEGYLRKVISLHNVFEFDDDTWTAFNKIFHSIGVYDSAEENRCDPNFKIVAVLYHIIKNIDMPNILINHIEGEISIYSIKDYLEKIKEVDKHNVYNYIYNFYLERIRKIDSDKDNMKVQCIHFLLEFMALFKKTKQDVPEVVMESINSNWETYRFQQILELPVTNATESDFLRYLKQDSGLLSSKITEFKNIISRNGSFRFNSLVQKLQTYFPGEEVTKSFLKLFNDLLSEESSTLDALNASVYGVLKLNDEKSNIEFMNKFAPQNPKIDYKNINKHCLRTQKAICLFAGYARPPVPLSSILLYVQGDYVHFCLPVFNMYQANLPLPLCVKFIEALLDTPVSIQKHALRLAFKNFSAENLRKLVLNTWKKTKNVSLRSVIYKALFEKVVNKYNKELFETLKMLTLDLKDYDSDELFDISVSNKLSDEFLGESLEAVWVAVENFKNNEKNLERKTRVIKRLNDFLYLINKKTAKKIASDHVEAMFRENNEKLDSIQDKTTLNVAKWQLVAHYIVLFTSNEEDLNESIKMAKGILISCIQGWNEVHSDCYVTRQMFAKFVDNLKCPYLPYTESFENAIPVFESILSCMQASLPLQDIYVHVWDLRITIITRQVVRDNRAVIEKDEKKVVEEAAVTFGKEMGNLVKEFVEKNMYFSFILEDVTKLINESAFELIRRLTDKCCLELDDVLLQIASGLLESNMVQNQLLALTILPVEPKYSLDSYKMLYDTFHKLPNAEVQCYLYQKYRGDCKRRRFE